MGRPDRMAAFILCAALLAGLATYSWRGWYARYFLDDYCTAAALQELGFADAMKYHRDTWSGRYSYFAFKAALESIGPATARVTLTLMLVLLLFAFWYALRRIVPERSALAMAVLGGTFLVLDASPSLLNVDGTYFWETGYVTYVLPLVLITIWLGLFTSTRSIASVCVASAALMFVAGGLSETSLAAQGALAAGLLLMALYLRNRRAVWIAGSSLIATLLALAVVASAPGNAVRAATYPTRLSLADAAMRALGYANTFIGSYVFMGGAAFLVVIGAGFVVGIVSPRVRPAVAGAFAALAVVAYVVSFFPSAWLLPTSPPPAAMDVPTYFLMLAVFAAAGAGGRAMADRGPQVLKGATILLLVLSIVPLWSTVSNVRAIPGDRERAARMDRLDETLRASRGRDVVVTERWPLAMRTLDGDEKHWSNVCVSRYYGLQSVRVKR